MTVITASADDLEELKAAAVHYVAAMKAVLKTSNCAEGIAKASEYAAAKVAYYTAARQAMPALLQMAKGEKTDSRYGQELTEIFQGYSEDKDQMATIILEAQLDRCPSSEKRDAALVAIERARQIAEQFVNDFGRLEGV